MKILITGVGGFLGRWVARHLQSQHEVTGVYHSKRPPLDLPLVASNQKPDGHFDVLVLCHASVSAGAVQQDDAALVAGNITFTQQVLDWFPQAKVIYISTVSVYPAQKQTVVELSDTLPQSRYAQTKLEAESLVLQRPQYAVVRLSSLYGSGMKDGTLIPNYVNQALCNGKIEVWGDGSRLQNYIHALDVAKLIGLIITNDAFHRALYLGTDAQSYTNAQVARLIAQKTNAAVEFVNNDNASWAEYDGSFTRKAVNWQPEMPLTKGLDEYIEWKKKQY